MDIEASAVDIAKLRLWLSLVVDENLDPTFDEQRLGIAKENDPRPLPNLDYNIICGNSLIDEFDGIKLFDDSILGKEQTSKPGAGTQLQMSLFVDSMQMYLDDLRREQERLFGEQNPETKHEIKRHIDKIIDDIIRAKLTKDNNAEGLKKYEESLKQKTKPYFLWKLEFAKVFRENGGFDIVIGNPPYVSTATMVENMPKERNAIIKCSQYTTLHQKWDLYIPFMELGLQLLRKNGAFAMIVPYPLTNQIYAKKLRHLIVNSYNLLEIVDLNGTKIFDNATVSNCIPIIQKSEPQQYCIVSHISENRQIVHSYEQPIDKLVQDKNSGIWNLTPENRDTARFSGYNLLGDYCYISKGMVLNADEKKAKGEFIKADLISSFQDEVHSKKYIEGKDLEKYYVKRNRFLEWNTNRCPSELSRPTFPELYESQKLLINALGELKASVDLDEKYYCEQQVRVAVLWKDLSGVENSSISSSVKRYSRYSREKMEQLSQEIDLRSLLAIINSKYASVLLRNLRSGDYHIVPEYLRNLPIPIVPPKTQSEIGEIVTNILAAKKDDPHADISDLTSQIDCLVYKLYGLTEDEIKIVEESVK
ncbi:MAG: Eco57I restriction-modification methylase domain-containing protein [Eubacteriales bacterium]|nr:Eco57I restriction-modification methylase domain-containing protein [Eubacteriales bacterium]